MTTAVIFERYGLPEVLRLAELPDPQAGPGQVRVRVKAAGADGDTLLVHAAAGSVGTIAVQLGRQWGATVIGTASPGSHGYLREPPSRSCRSAGMRSRTWSRRTGWSSPGAGRLSSRSSRDPVGGSRNVDGVGRHGGGKRDRG